MGIWTPWFHCSIISVKDWEYGLSLQHTFSHLMKRIHIHKVSLSLVQGLTTLKESDISDLGIIYSLKVFSVFQGHLHTHTLTQLQKINNKNHRER